MTLEEPMKTVSSCCYSDEIGYDKVEKQIYCRCCMELCTLTWPPCPLNICDGSGITIENAGMCGGCDTCGSREETEKPCPHTL